MDKDTDDSYTADANWDSADVIKLIQLYKNCPALWNTKHELYHNTLLKRNFIAQIAKCMDRSPKSISTKIRKIRFTYYRMYKKIRNGYKGQIWFGYEAMSFLTGHYDEKYTNLEKYKRMAIENGDCDKKESTKTDSDDSNQEQSQSEETFNEFANKKQKGYKGSWKYGEILKLIELIKDHPELWNMKHHLYYSKVRKDNAYKKIGKILQKTRPDIIARIKTLKTMFARVDKKVKETIQTNGKFTSKLWFGYKRMAFLDEETMKICDSELLTYNTDDEADTSVKPNLTVDNEDDESNSEKKMGKWEQKDVLKLIQLHKEHPEMWDNQYGYGGYYKTERNKLLKTFTKILNKEKWEIERKFRSLRAQFWRQHKALINAVREGTQPAAKVWFLYEPLSFLATSRGLKYAKYKYENMNCEMSENGDDEDDTEEETSNNVDETMDERVNEKVNEADPVEKTFDVSIVKEECFTSALVKEEYQPMTPKGIDDEDPLTHKNDEFSAFGQFVSEEMRKINNNQALLMAKSEITNILFKAIQFSKQFE